jgi:hypothetical protein
MKGTSKGLALILALTIIITSLIAINPISAQSIPQPSVPIFTVKEADHSYDVPAKSTTSIDPFNGKQVITTIPGYHVSNLTIDVIIRNQPFTPVDFENGTIIQLYYTVRLKGHFSDWGAQNAANGYSSQTILASTSDYTVVSFIVGSENDILMGRANLYVPNGGQEDFEIKAQTGYLVPDYGGHVIPQPFGYTLVSLGDSGWSDIQTMTYRFGLLGIIYDPEAKWLLILPLILAVEVAFLSVKRFRKSSSAQTVTVSISSTSLTPLKIPLFHSLLLDNLAFAGENL